MGHEAEGREIHAAGMRRLAQLPREHPLLGHIRSYLLTLGARIALDDGDLDRAGQVADESYASAVATNDLPILASTGVMVAELTAARGRPSDAAEILGAAARLRGADDRTAVDISALENCTLRGGLGDAPFEAALPARGRALARDAARSPGSIRPRAESRPGQARLR